jgi:glycosyltransferase involved in cell wall biosynthesis
MTSRPVVSVIVPVKNGERFLAQALGDVRAQTYTPIEVVVVDGRSTDRSVEIARSFAGVRCISQSGDGFADAWNAGLAESGGELVAFLDSDDRWMPGKIAAQVDVLERRPEVDYVITRMRFFTEPGVTTPPGFRPSLLAGDHVANMPSALLARRSVFDLVGRFPTDYSIANDIEWFARLKDSPLRREVLHEVLVEKRVHDGNLSYFAASGLNSELLRLLRESVARKRGSA